MTVEESCCMILKYLDSIWGSLSSSGWLYFIQSICTKYFKYGLFYYCICIVSTSGILLLEPDVILRVFFSKSQNDVLCI